MDKIDDIDKYIVDSINDINVKLKTLDERISDLEKPINKPILKITIMVNIFIKFKILEYHLKII